MQAPGSGLGGSYPIFKLVFPLDAREAGFRGYTGVVVGKDESGSRSSTRFGKLTDSKA